MIAQLGPFSGMDNAHRPDARTFQVPGEREDRRMALGAATDVDLDDDGWPVSREGLAQTVTGNFTALFDDLAQEVVQVPALPPFLFTDASRIVRVGTDPWATTELVTGLDADARVRFCAHAGQVFWSNGSEHGRIAVGGAAYNWGATVCRVTVAAGTGALAAGKYLVAGEFIDASGVKHAAEAAASITLASPAGITVSLPAADDAAVYVRLYVAGPNRPDLFLLGDVAVGAFPYTITTLPAESTPCWTIGLSPPIAHDFAFSWGNRIVLVKDSAIYPSMGAAAHLFNLATEVMGRPETVLAAGQAGTGFWTVSSRGAYYATQEGVIDSQIKAEFCAGSYRTNTTVLPWLRAQQPTRVTLFWSVRGLAVGMPDGQMIFPMQDSHRSVVTGKYASFTVRHTRGIEQLLVNLTE